MPTTVRLPPETEERLDRLARITGRSKAYYLRELIESGLDRLEWEQRILQRAADIRAGREETIPSAEVRKSLGLDD